MANPFPVKTGRQLVFANHSGDFNPTAKTSLVRSGSTNVQLTMTGVLNGAGRESAKVDLGATRAEWWGLAASLEFAATPTSGEIVEARWAPSPQSLPANGNPMSINGADADAPSGIGTLDELIGATQYAGTFKVANLAAPNVLTAYMGRFRPAEQYGILIPINRSGASFHSDGIEIHFVMWEILPELQ